MYKSSLFNLSDQEKLSLLKDENCSISILEELSNDEYHIIRAHVAIHRNCSISILEKLSNDKNSLVKEHVFKNRNTPNYILVKCFN